MSLALGLRAADGQQPGPYGPRYPLPQNQQPQIQQPQYPPGQGQFPPQTAPQYQQQPPPYQQFPQPAPTFAGQPQQAAFNVPPPPVEVFKPAEIMARVGDQFIFYGDVAPTVDMMLDGALVKAKSDAERTAILQQRDQVLRPVLQQYIQNKTMYLAFDRDLRKNAKDKYKDARTSIDKKIRAMFEEQMRLFRDKVAKASPEEISMYARQSPVVVRLVLLMRDHHLESWGELETKLRSLGTSLDQQILQFGESALGREMAGRHFKQKQDVTLQEMLDYYEKHAEDFRVKAKARFELLTAKLENHNNNREAAHAAIAAMGNRVVYGTPLAAVAKQESQEPNAKSGGYYDWVNEGSLASKPIDAAVFSLEPGKLSEIINDDTGCHIVRVLERTPAGMISFVETQPKIREAIELQKKEAEYKKFLELLQKNTEVWTIFDAPKQQ